MGQRLVVIGAGGMGRCVLDVVDAINAADGERLEMVGVVDDGVTSSDLLAARGVRLLGAIDVLEELPADVGYVIGIGDGPIRRRLEDFVSRGGRASPALVHPNAHRGHGVTIGDGSVVCSHVSIENNVRIGRHVHVNQNSTVGHDSDLADFATVSPLVAVSGGVRLGEAAFLGTGCAINQGLAVGDGAVVGAGAAVISDVAAGSTVVGVPARPLDG